MARKPLFRTVRCVIATDDRYLLAIHNGRPPFKRTRWGLIGGRVERDEALEAAVRREVREELYLDLGDLVEVGDYRYKGHSHRVFGVETRERVIRFDRSELIKIGWHSIDDVEEFADRNLLHTGFEYQAIQAYRQQRRLD